MPLLTLQGHRHEVYSLAFSPDDKTLAPAGNDKAIKLWEVTAGKERATLRGPTGRVTFIAFSTGGETLASNASDGTVRVWDTAQGKEKLSVPTKSISYAMAYSPDGKSLALGGFEGVVLWDTGDWRVRAALKSEAKSIYGVAFSPDEKTLASACADRSVRLWDVAARVENALLPHGSAVLSVSISPDGKLVCSGNGTIATAWPISVPHVAGSSPRRCRPARHPAGPHGDRFLVDIVGALLDRDPRTVRAMVEPWPDGTSLVRFPGGPAVPVPSVSDPEVLLGSSV